MNIRWIVICIVICIGVVIFPACSGDMGESTARIDTADEAAAMGGREKAGTALAALVERYFEENLILNPLSATFIGDSRYNDRLANTIGPAYRRDSLALEKRYLAQVGQIDADLLADQDRLTWEIFILNRENAIERSKYPAHLIPVNQMFSIQNVIAQLGSGQSVQPFVTIEDYDNWLSRLDDFVVYVDQAIVNMREGMQGGVVMSQIIMEKVLPQLEAHIVSDPNQSLFYGPVGRIPNDYSEDDRARLGGAYALAIAEKVVPAYQRLHSFIKDEYLPACTKDVGLDEVPDGKEWYAFLARINTTTDLSPIEIHEIGLAEVARIRNEMEGVREQVGFEGTLPEFFEFVKTDDRFYFENEQDLIDGYGELKVKIDSLLPKMFGVFPKADYEVRPVEAFRAASAAGASYQRAAPDGSRPGVFYINTYNLRAQPKFGLETLSLHEASPGHHFQGSIQQELEDLPRFRRFGSYTAYSEGWALYAESIGRELGLFTDPYQYYGRLNDEMLRAMRLVVDTGLHAKGWTREQVIEYMLENSSMAQTDVIAEAERYVAIPGQALGYKIGQLEITRIRAKAERELGDSFDIRAFHDQILKDGALPMSVLAAKIDRWVLKQKTT